MIGFMTIVKKGLHELNFAVTFRALASFGQFKDEVLLVVFSASPAFMCVM
jgi:hypothetical protein